MIITFPNRQIQISYNNILLDMSSYDNVSAIILLRIDLNWCNSWFERRTKIWWTQYNLSHNFIYLTFHVADLFCFTQKSDKNSTWIEYGIYSSTTYMQKLYANVWNIPELLPFTLWWPWHLKNLSQRRKTYRYCDYTDWCPLIFAERLPYNTSQFPKFSKEKLKSGLGGWVEE